MDTAEADDGTLLRRWRTARDEAAFTALVARHLAMLRAVAARIVGPNQADDLAQAAFIVLLRRAGTLEQRRDLGGWLHLTVTRLALNARRAARRQRLMPLQEDAMAPDEADADAVRARLAPLLDAALAALPERERLAVVLHHLEGLPHAVIAARCGVAEGTVASWLSRGRERLRTWLARHGMGLTPAALVLGLSGLSTPAVGAEVAQSTVAGVVHAPTPAAVLLAGTPHRWLPGLLVAGLIAGLGGLGALWLGDDPPAVDRIGVVRRHLDREVGLVVHFGMATFTRADAIGAKPHQAEIETGTEPTAAFAPTVDSIDVAAWMDLARDAGLRSITLTVRHAGGFCLWDSATTTHDVVGSSYGKDLLREFVTAARARGLAVGLFYNPFDALRSTDPMTAKAQLRELLGDYGPIDILWLEAHRWNEGRLRLAEVTDLVHRLQPGCVIVSNRFHAGGLIDIAASDRVGPAAADSRIPRSPPAGPPAELCESLRRDGRWFWHPLGAEEAKSPAHIVETWRRLRAVDAHYLLGVSPGPDGRIPAAQRAALLDASHTWHPAGR